MESKNGIEYMTSVINKVDKTRTNDSDYVSDIYNQTDKELI